MYLIINKTDGYIEESNGNKYLIFASKDNKKEVLTKYGKIWDTIQYLIKTINGGKASECEKEFMKIKLNSDDNLPLNKILKLHNLTVMLRSDFAEDGKYYPKDLLDECLYEL